MCSARVFISHASEDKTSLVRPLVDALLHENVSIWLDRPGLGDSNLGLTDEVIRRHDIRSLVAGVPWDAQILEAQRSCGAVLACLSRALTKDRQVLVHELLLARYANKLVTCIVDDLPYDQIPSDLGLAGVSHLQAPRVNTKLLGQAVSFLREQPDAVARRLDPPLLEQWEIFSRVLGDIREILRRDGAQIVTQAELAQVRESLRLFPHAPQVRFFEVPQALVDLLAERLDTPASARRHFELAMQLAFDSRDKEDTRQQVVVSKGEITEQVPMLDYWAQVVAVAGSKSRRTLAALFLAPHAVGLANLPPDLSKQVAQFIGWLRDPELNANPITGDH